MRPGVKHLRFLKLVVKLKRHMIVKQKGGGDDEEDLDVNNVTMCEKQSKFFVK